MHPMKQLLLILSLVCCVAAAHGTVVMSHFEAIPLSNRVNFQWGTSSEVNNYFFELWRDTIPLIQITGHGTTSSPQEYTWADLNAVNETRYMYRLYCSGTPRDSVAGSDIVPPHWITLNSYGVSPGDHQVAIHWTTAAEIYSIRFDITRNHVPITSVNGQGHSVTPHNYFWTDFDAQNGTEYTYTLWAVDWNARRDSLATGTVTPMAVGPRDALLPADFRVTAYPNPFNPSSTLAFSLPRESRVDVAIRDISGRTLQEFSSPILPAGNHQFQFDGTALPSGVYFAQLTTSFAVNTQKLLLMK
jgi:hypothetical protein